MGVLNLDNRHQNNSLVRAIHTAVKGRARYKVNGLDGSEALQRYLGFRLSKESGIMQVSANQWTGNVLVIFHPDFSPKAIASLIQDIVQDYAKEIRKLATKQEKAKTPVKKQSTQVRDRLILASAVTSTLALGTGVLYRYHLDKSILLLIQQLHTPLLDRIMLGVTFLGEPLVLLLISLELEFSLLYQHRWEASRLGLATASAIGLNFLLKLLFGRARPALWEHIIDVGHSSFPSGHAMVSMVIYGFISYILAKEFPQSQKQIGTLTVILIILIGFSRLYLGVHWPTDILAGYAIGFMWLSVCILSLEMEQQYQKIQESRRC